MEETKERLGYIDVAKGLAILSIMIVHISENYYVKSILLMFNVPIFYIISGFLMRWNEQKNGLQTIKSIFKNGIKTLMIPYFVFCFIVLTIQMLQINDKQYIQELIASIFNFNGLLAMWFLPVLFATRILFACIQKIKNKWIKTLILILPVIYFAFFKNENWYMNGQISIVVLERISMGLMYYTVGYYLYKFIKNTEIPSIFLILAIILVMFCTIYIGTFDLYTVGSDNLTLSIILSMIECICIIMLLRKMPQSKILSFCGKNSIVLLVTHQTVQVMLWWSLGDISLAVKFILFGILYVTIELLLIVILNKFFPLLIRKITKQNKKISTNINKKYI